MFTARRKQAPVMRKSGFGAHLTAEGNFTPGGFLLQGVEHQIEIISRHWQDGDAMHYLVMVPINSVYELIFNYQAKRWSLKDLIRNPGSGFKTRSTQVKFPLCASARIVAL